MEKEFKDGLTRTDRLNEYLDKLESAGMDRTKRWVSIWKENLRYFFSDQLSEKRNHRDWEWVVLNYIWPSAMQEIAKLAKHDPKIICNPLTQDDGDYAEAWQGILQWLWNQGINTSGMRMEQIAQILDCKLFGYSVSKVLWDNKVRWNDQTKQWEGEVVYRLWHPAEFWASDTEKIFEGSVGTTRIVTLEWAQSQWPEFAKKLEDEAETYKGEFSKGNIYISGQTSKSGTYPAAGTGGIDKGVGTAGENLLLSRILQSDRMTASNPSSEETKFIKLSETYFYDYSETDEKIEEDVPKEELLATGQMQTINGMFHWTNSSQPVAMNEWPRRTVKEWKQPKFPTGRYVIRAGKLILNPKEVDQVYPYSRWPFVVIPHYLLPHMWQGSDCVQMYKSTQDMINVTVSHLVNNLKQFGDPKIAVEKGAIDAPADRSKAHYRIGSGAGSIIRLVKGGLNRFMILNPQPPSEAAIALYTMFQQEYKNIVGLQDIAQGKMSKGITATEAQALAISANDRISLQSTLQDQWITQVASLMAEVAQKNYDIGRMVRILGEDNIVGASEITQQLKSVKFDVRIIPGTTLPFDEEKQILKYKEAYMMLAQPTPNPMLPEMLQVLGIPNWKKLLQRYEPYQQYMQLMQLYEAVKAGQIQPQQAVQMIVQKATELYMQSQQSVEGQVQQNQQQQKAQGVNNAANSQRPKNNG